MIATIKRVWSALVRVWHESRGAPCPKCGATDSALWVRQTGVCGAAQGGGGMTTTTTQLPDGGRVARTTYSDGTWVQFTYNDAGQRVREEWSNDWWSDGWWREYTYDTNGRLIDTQSGRTP